MSVPQPLSAWLQLSTLDRAAQLAVEGDPSATLLSLGDHCERLASIEVATALHAIDELLADAHRNNLPQVTPRLLRAKVMALAYAGRLDDALGAAQASQRAAEDLARPIDAARAQIASLHPLTKLGRIDDAIRAGNHAREQLIALHEPMLAARADINLGNIHKAAGHPDQAAEHLERARTLLKDDPRMLAHIENTLGEVHYLRDDLPASRAAFCAALAHFHECSERFAAAIVEGNLADLAAREGNLQEALAYFERARRTLERDAAPGHGARLAAEEAEVLASLGAPAEAEAALEHSLPWLESNGFVIEAARARLARAYARARQGQFDAAQRDLESVIERASEQKHRRLAQRARLLSCELALLSQPTLETTHDRVHSLASELLASTDLPRIDRMIAAHHLAVAEARRGVPTNAFALVSTAIDDARAMGLAPLASDLLLARADLASSASEAVRDLEAAVSEVERIRTTIRAERLRATWLGSRTRAYERLALARLAEGTSEALDAAFDTVERSKSRSLLDLVQRAVDRCKPAAPADADERRLVDELEALRRRLNALYARWDDESSLGERRIALPTGTIARDIKREEAALERITARLAAMQGERSVLATPLPAREIRARLAPHVALIEYFVAEDQLLAFVVRRDGTRLGKRLGVASELTPLIQRMLFAMRRATRAEARGQRVAPAESLRELADLYDALIAPLTGELDGITSLIIVPHSMLHGVPFHALRSGEISLIDRFSIATAPSAALGLARSGDVRSPAANRCIIGVSDRAAPSIAAEVEAIAAVWKNADVLQDRDATASAFLQAAPNASLLHLACHGRFADAMPFASGVRMSDRWVSLREILSLRLRAELVILAGCDTGRAAIEPGDELIGLARGFLAAGARGVIVSQWPVGDDAAASFMIDLHRHLAAGSAAIDAVRQASLTMKRERPHPAMWGAFSLVGE